MAIQTDRIEKEVRIAAPVERVWELITSARHLGRWFGDAGAEIDLRAGGTLTVHWSGYTLRGRIEAVEVPRRFSYRWLHAEDPEAEPTPANSTLVEFAIEAEGDGTRVAVVESGFDSLEHGAAERAALLTSHTTGWRWELGELASYTQKSGVVR